MHRRTVVHPSGAISSSLRLQSDLHVLLHNYILEFSLALFYLFVYLSVYNIYKMHLVSCKELNSLQMNEH